MKTTLLLAVLLPLTSQASDSQRPTPKPPAVSLRLDTPRPYIIAGAPPSFRIRVYNRSSASISVLNVAKYGYLSPHFSFSITQAGHPVPLGGAIADLAWQEDVLIAIPPGSTHTLVGENRQIDLDSLRPGSYRLSVAMLFGYPSVEEATSNTVAFEVRQR
jgi:hypothetical protein